MLVSLMVQHDLCQKCNQKQDCGKVYEQLGKIEGPSIVRKVVLAFLLPLIVFTFSLAIFEKMFSTLTITGQLQSGLSFAAALLLTVISIVLTKLIGGKLSREK